MIHIPYVKDSEERGDADVMGRSDCWQRSKKERARSKECEVYDAHVIWRCMII